MNQIKEWLLSREPRERKLIVIGGSLLGLLILHAAVWNPIVNGYHKQQQQLQRLRNDVQWMRGAANTLKQNQNQNQNKRPSRNTGPQGSLPTLVDRSARASQIINFIKRVEPRGNDKVQIVIEQASFNHLIAWIDIMRTQFKLVIKQVNINRGAKPGVINARIILSRSGL